MSKPALNFFPALLLAGLLLPLLAMAALGLHSRYIADDYCTTYRALSQGVIGSTLWWYTHWSGRFAQWAVTSAAVFVGTGLTAALPALILAGWTAAAVWAAHQVARAVRLPQPRLMALALGALAVYAVFDGTPSRIQSLYWLSASIPYTLPLIVLTFLAGFVINTLRHRPHRAPPGALAAVAVMTFAAGGLSEVYAAFQTAALGLALLAVAAFAPPHIRRPALALLGLGLVFSVLAMLLILAAPGNAARRSMFPEPLPLAETAWRTFYTTLAYPFIAFQRFSAVPLAVSALLPMLLMYQLDPLESRLRLSPRAARRLLALSAAVALILMMACIAPPIYAMGVPPAARVYLMPQFILTLTAIFWGCVLGLAARRQSPRLKPAARLAVGVGIAALMIAGPLASTATALAQLPDFRQYAADWDRRDQAIRDDAARGLRHIETTMLAVDIGQRAGLEVIGPDPALSINACAAGYYGVETLTARTLLPMGDKVR